MRKSFTLLVLLFLPFLVWAQTVVVPKNVYFADIQLIISNEAQLEIQKKVDALHQHPTFFKKRVELADAYFPLIERVFRESGVPEDLKYLSIQESGLIGDAVSTSNAVGYWQFKREAASDFNLRINSQVDERKHIIEASRGAANYFIRSNNYYKNWFNSILSYYLGYSGAKPYTSTSDIGSRKMDVTDKTHPYLLTFLAHKIAFENFVGKTNSPVVSIKELRATPGQSLAEIALDNQTDLSELEKYNKWLLGSTIPSDKEYFVLLPVRLSGNEQVILASKDQTAGTSRTAPTNNRAAAVTKQNGLNALIARTGDTKDILALQAGISTRKFLRYNDMHNFDEIVAGEAYYIESKNSKGTTEFHVVQRGETMQAISQKHGIKLSQLLFKNRMARNEVPVPGRVLWLQKRRPYKTPVEVQDVKAKQATVAATSTATPAASQPTAAKSATETDATAPKDNIFKRFIRSFDRFKKQPATTARTEVKQTPAVVKAEPVAAKADSAAITEVAVEPVNTTVSETPAKPKEVALYPGKKPVGSKPVEQPKDTSKTEAETMATETAQQVQTTEVTDKPATEQKDVYTMHHTVKQGETLYSISRQYSITVADIINWNKLGDTPIKIGQELLIAEPLNSTEPSASPFQEQETKPISTVQANKDYHTVEPGETLYQISKKYNVSLAELQQWNNLTANNISIGQKLRVTAPENEPIEEAEPAKTEAKPATSTSSETIYHTVAAGESMYQISRKYDVTIKDIMQWNNKSDFNVSLGEKLLIKKK